MGFFSRNKARFEVAKAGLEVGIEQQRNLPKTTAGMNARMEATMEFAESQVAFRNKTMRLMKYGVPTPATLDAATLSQQQFYTQANLQWTVHPPGGADYSATSVDRVGPQMVPLLVAGTEFMVKVDPEDPQSVMAMTPADSYDANAWAAATANIPGDPAAPAAPAAPAPAAPAAPSSDVDRLAKLAELHTSGMITDEEFAAQKAKILGS